MKDDGAPAKKPAAAITAPIVAPLCLLLRHVSFDAVEFHAILPDGRERQVRVLVGSSGQSWSQAVRFPTLHSNATETLGDHELDQAVRERAAEELVRLEAVSAIVDERRAA